MLLREKDKQTLTQIFTNSNFPMEVWAYGSRVNGSAHAGSDLDLVARSFNLKPIPIEIYVDLGEKIRDSNIPILVEFRDWAMLPESFRHNITQQFEVLYASIAPVLNEPLLKYQTNLTEDKNAGKS